MSRIRDGAPQTICRWVSSIVIVWCIGAAGCAVVGGYNARAHEHMTSLKAHHLKLIDDVTKQEEMRWDAERFAASADTLDLRFREAVEFAESLGDRLRSDNLQLLWDVCRADVERIERNDGFLTREQAEIMRHVTEKAYDTAIQGERVRVGAPD